MRTCEAAECANGEGAAAWLQQSEHLRGSTCSHEDLLNLEVWGRCTSDVPNLCDRARIA